MKFDALVGLVGHLPWFDLATLVQLTGERRRSTTNQLHRFCKAGKVVPLRRGMYVLAARYRRMPVQPAELAGAIYRPSYLSGPWALSYHGLIPEGVPVFTSVTSRTTRRFHNQFGEYAYQNVKQSLFFGYLPTEIGGRKVVIASPEKALVDTWHLSPGRWTVERTREMRFAQGARVNAVKLEAIVNEIGKPRLVRAYELWRAVLGDDTAAEVEL